MCKVLAPGSLNTHARTLSAPRDPSTFTSSLSCCVSAVVLEAGAQRGLKTGTGPFPVLECDSNVANPQENRQQEWDKNMPNTGSTLGKGGKPTGVRSSDEQAAPSGPGGQLACDGRAEHK